MAFENPFDISCIVLKEQSYYRMHLGKEILGMCYDFPVS